MYSALTLNDLADGVHPNANGYNKMGDVWFKAIKDELAK
jgi:lysophospholipase L1-like esterase